jgi:hypothetical protein
MVLALSGIFDFDIYDDISAGVGFRFLFIHEF